MKKLIIFDLDGTLLDTSEGIMHCYHTTGELLKLEKRKVEEETIVIGAPLEDGFLNLYNIKNAEELNKAVSTYRELYAEEGIARFSAYSGIEDALKKLKENGYTLAVATLKLEEYAVVMLKKAGLYEYFDLICGWDGVYRCSKAVMITGLLYRLNSIASDAILVGDSYYDETGADTAGVDFLGVSYGFGFREEDAEKRRLKMVKRPDEIPDFINSASNLQQPF